MSNIFVNVVGFLWFISSDKELSCYEDCSRSTYTDLSLCIELSMKSSTGPMFSLYWISPCITLVKSCFVTSFEALEFTLLSTKLKCKKYVATFFSTVFKNKTRFNGGKFQINFLQINVLDSFKNNLNIVWKLVHTYYNSLIDGKHKLQVFLRSKWTQATSTQRLIHILCVYMNMSCFLLYVENKQYKTKKYC